MNLPGTRVRVVRTGTLPIGIASLALRQARVTTVLITQPGATLENGLERSTTANSAYSRGPRRPIMTLSSFRVLPMNRVFLYDSWPHTGKQPERPAQRPERPGTGCACPLKTIKNIHSG
jgi:hypothetical protein